MSQEIGQRTRQRLESALLRVAACVVVAVGTGFIGWQLGHVIGVDGG